MKIRTLFLLVAVTSACSMMAPTHEMRATDYTGGGLWGLFTGKFQGFRVVNEGAVTGCVDYKSSTARYRSVGCIAMPADADPTVETIKALIDKLEQLLREGPME